MNNTEGIVLLIGMLITFIGIPTYCICCKYKTNTSENMNTYTQLNSSTPSNYVEAKKEIIYI